MKRWLGWALVSAIAGCAPSAQNAKSADQVQLAADSLDGRQWLEREADVATSMGAGPLRIVATDFGTEGDRIGAFVSITNNQCLLAYARGSFGVEDLDLYAYADDGATLAIDEASDPHPAIVICPPQSMRAYVAARIARGRGIVALGVHNVSPEVVGPIGQALGARGRPGEEVGRAETWPGLDERIAERRKALGGQWEELRRVAVPVDARAPTLVSAELEPDQCLDVLVLPTEEPLGLDVTVLDGDGRIATRAAVWGRDRTSLVCASTKTPVAIELRPRAGHGLAAVVLSRSSTFNRHELPGAVSIAHIGTSLDIAQARERRAKELRALGYSKATTVANGKAEVGRKASVDVQLPEGCSRIDVIGGKPISGLLVDLWDANGTLLASTDGDSAPFVFVCGPGGRARIDVEATSRPGPFAIELRTEAISPTPLVAQPVAASRLLRYLATRAPTTASSAADAHALSLNATSVKSLELPLPAGRCADVVAAVDAGGSGLELRVLDAEGSEVSLGRGETLATTRACAGRGSRTVKAELRLRAGQANALVLVRPIPLTTSE